MKKTLPIGAVAGLAAVVAVIALWVLSAEPISAQNGVSEPAAAALQAKIDKIKAASQAGNGHGRQTVEVSEVELESYVVYGLREDIPARVDSVDVQLTEGAVAADTKMTFASDSTGNPLVDVLIAGTHNLFVKGKLAASGKHGRFELSDVKVDGIPVPTILIEALIARYVKPKYPDVDLKEPFPMPWNMESLTITPGKATIVY